MAFRFFNKGEKNHDDKTSCKTCKTNCLDEVMKDSKVGLGYSDLPYLIQLKMDKLRELFTKITEDIKQNNYLAAKQKKQQALEVYADMLKDITYSYGPNHPLALNFYYVVELILQRHTDAKSYKFLNE